MQEKEDCMKDFRILEEAISTFNITGQASAAVTEGYKSFLRRPEQLFHSDDSKSSIPSHVELAPQPLEFDLDSSITAFESTVNTAGFM